MNAFSHLVAVRVAGDSANESAQRLLAILAGVAGDDFAPPAVVCSLPSAQGEGPRGSSGPFLLALLELAEEGALLRFAQEHGWPHQLAASAREHGQPSWGWNLDEPAAPRYHSARDALAAARLIHERGLHPSNPQAPRLPACSDGELFRFAEVNGWPTSSTPMRPVPLPTYWHWGTNCFEALPFPDPRAALVAACTGAVSAHTGLAPEAGEKA